MWTREELQRVRDICHRNGVRVLSDEIHCELIHSGYEYIPYAIIDPDAIVCCSPSKAFNTAGLQTANIVCPDMETKALIDRTINDNEVCDINPFGVVALEAAYNHGGEWLDALNAYLDDNYRYLRETLGNALPQLRICNSEATYLAWVDITPLHLTSDDVEKLLIEKAKVRINSGAMYDGEGYIRINYACPRARLERSHDSHNKYLRVCLEDTVRVCLYNVSYRYQIYPGKGNLCLGDRGYTSR